MGSTSSKEHDPNPTELGTYASSGGGGQYPLRHHPQYGSSSNTHGSSSSSSQQQQQYHDGSSNSAGGRNSTGDTTMYNAAGHDPYYTHQKSAYPSSQQQQQHMYHDASNPSHADPKHSSSHATNDAMDIDPPPSSSDLAFLPSNLPPSQLDSTSAGGSLESDSGSTSGGLNSTPSAADVVPMVFRWEHGGRNVYITGTFNGWSKQCPMHRSGNDFTYIANLTRGKHAYKFVVDDEWRFAPDQLTVADVEGNVNNFVDVSEFTPLSDFETSTKHSDEKNERGESAYGRFIPDIDEYTKEPPPLPPHLRHIILNKTPPTVDSRLLPVPQHVALNHLYCTAIKDGMMVLGITNRYKQKFVTTVYYSLMPGAN